MRPARVCSVLVALLLLVPGCDQSVSDLLARYFDGYDNRVTAFCSCFPELLGYADGASAECTEGRILKGHQRGCLEGIFADGGEELEGQSYSPKPALRCLGDAEERYAACLDRLACDDLEGLDACTEGYNDDRRACPRLASTDESNFNQCLAI